MKATLRKLNFTKILCVLKRALMSKFFPFATAAVNILCYYLGLDIVMIYYTAIAVMLILLLCDDISPLISVFLFMNVIVSKRNSPSYTVGSSQYYFQTEILAQIIVLICFVAGGVIYRIAKCAVKKQFKPTPVFYGLCILAAALVLNGVFSENYQPLDIMYGAFTAFFFLGIFVLMKDNVKPGKELFERVAFGFIALSAVLLIELAVVYATAENLFVNGGINRGLIMFGWGIYNTYGMLMMICIPAALFLAMRIKHGYLFTVYSFILFAACILCMSRQSMLASAVIFLICIIVVLVKGKYRLQNFIICGIALQVAAILIGVFHTEVEKVLANVFGNIQVNGELDGSSRAALWRTGFMNFLSAPVFGSGFFVDLPQAAPMVGLDIIPLMYHNTFIQLLGACGILGFIAYIIHRIQTVICFFKKITLERSYIAITIVALLLISIFDNHMFYLLPTLVYSGLLSVLVKSEEA